MSPEEVAARVKEASRLIPTKDLLAVLRGLADARVEMAKVERDLVRLEIVGDVTRTRMELRYGLLHEVVGAVFAERRDTLDRIFEVIEGGLADGRTDVVLGGLRSVGQIVASSPLADIDKLARALDEGEPIEI